MMRLLDGYRGVREASPTDKQIVTAIALRIYADQINDVPEFLEHVQLPEALEPITDPD